jgi:hypothetical protein
MKRTNWGGVWFSFISVLALLLSGCQTAYMLPTGIPTANISFDVSTDSTGTTGLFYSVLNFGGVDCHPSEYGEKITGKSFAGEHETFGPFNILAEAPFTFAVKYTDSRFAQNRECSYTASFTPREGRNYLATFKTIGNVSSCNMTIGESHQQKYETIEFISPELTCAPYFHRPTSYRGRNGQPHDLNWSVSVGSVPIKK